LNTDNQPLHYIALLVWVEDTFVGHASFIVNVSSRPMSSPTSPPTLVDVVTNERRVPALVVTNDSHWLK